MGEAREPGAKAEGLKGWGGGLVWALACYGPAPWGVWCGTQGARKTFQPPHHFKKKNRREIKGK